MRTTPRPIELSRRRRTCAACLLLLGTGACTTTSPRRPFEDVRDDVQARTGHSVAWNRFAEGAEEIQTGVDDLLAEPLTPDAAVQIALLNNRRLQAMYAQLGVAQADLVQAGLLRNPVFQGSFRWEPHTQRTFEFGVMQDFLDVLTVPLERAVARTELASAKLRVTESAVELAVSTRRAYYRYVANHQRFALWADVLQSAEAAYAMAGQLRAAGNITELALLEEQAAYEEVKLRYARVEALEFRYRERLNRLMGLWGADTGWRAIDGLSPAPEDAIAYADVERRAVFANLELERTLKRIEAVATRYRLREVTRVLPELRLGASMEFEKESANKLVEHRRRDGTRYTLEEVPGPTEIWSGPQFNVSLPVFDWGQAASAAGRAEVERRFDEYAALAIEVRSAARELTYRAANAQQRAKYQAQVLVPLQAAIMQETQLRYNAMFDGVFRLLRAKRRELETQIEAVDALAEFWLAHAELEQLMMGSMPEEFRTGMGEGSSRASGERVPMHTRSLNDGTDEAPGDQDE